MKATRTCSVPDCERPRKSRGWCNTHYERWRIHGTTDLAPRPTSCAVDGCDRAGRIIRGWCKYHWQRWSRYGDPVVGPMARRARASGQCAVEGCERPDSSRGWCKAHAYRWRQYGDPLAGSAPMPQAPRPSDWVPGYSAAHWRVRKANGPASEFTCVDCAGAAEHWSYDHSDRDELTDPKTGLTYSLDVERYDPRCVSCHRRFDLGA